MSEPQCPHRMANRACTRIGEAVGWSVRVSEATCRECVAAGRDSQGGADIRQFVAMRVLANAHREQGFGHSGAVRRALEGEVESEATRRLRELRRNPGVQERISRMTACQLRRIVRKFGTRYLVACLEPYAS